MAKAVRDRFGKPTIAIGNIRDPKIADDILARGDADLIGMGRGLIADPELPFDYGFVCLGMRANAPIWNDIQEAFTGEDVEVLNIGDSVRARRIIDGTDAGRHMVLNTLERLNYL